MTGTTPPALGELVTCGDAAAIGAMFAGADGAAGVAATKGLA